MVIAIERLHVDVIVLGVMFALVRIGFEEMESLNTARKAGSK